MLRIGRSHAALALSMLTFLAGCDDGDEPGATESAQTGGDEPEAAERQPQTGPEAQDEDEPDLPGDPDIWREKSDAEVSKALADARARARENDRRVLIDFLAPWCDDCREVVRVSQREPARSLLEERYETVHVNVGRFDRHEDLLAKHEVERIAALVVLSPDGETVAQTTLEPISKGANLTPQALAQWLADPEDAPEPPGAH